jgi:Flp pilus assembly protein TadG
MKVFRHLRTNERGSSAIEFAVVGPIFMMCMVGMVYVGMALLAEGSLQYAVEASARCAAVNTTLCASSAATVTYAMSEYRGPTIPPKFVSTTAQCGQQVTGSATMTMNWVLGKATVPLKATACFP